MILKEFDFNKIAGRPICIYEKGTTPVFDGYLGTISEVLAAIPTDFSSRLITDVRVFLGEVVIEVEKR